MVQSIRIRNSIDRCIDCQSEKKDIADPPSARGYTRDHLPTSQGLDKDEVGHYRDDVVVGGEWSEPVNGKVVRPDKKDGDVDGQNPDHQY